MAESILGGVSEGIGRGMQIAQFLQDKKKQEFSQKATTAQLMMEKRKQEFAQDASVAEQFFKIGANATLTPGQRQNYMGRGIKLLQKWYPDIDIPDTGKMEPDALQELGQDYIKLIADAKKNNLPQKVVIETMREKGRMLRAKMAAMGVVLDDNQEKAFKSLTDFSQEQVDERIANLEQERNVRESERRKARLTGYVQSIEQRDPVVKKLNLDGVNMGSVDSLISLVNDGNTIAFNALGLKMAKSMGEVGVMTEQDVRRYVESGKLTQKAADRVLKWIRGKPSDATVDEIGEIASALQAQMASKLQPRIDKLIDHYAAIEKMSPEEFAAEVRMTYGGGKQGGDGNPDSTGYVVGKSYKMKDGNMATYKGNGVFE